jgi:L-malate glycosyltransferase
MKVLNLVDSVPRGGTETLLYDFANNSAVCGQQTITVALGGGAMYEDFASSCIDFRIFKRQLPIDPSVIAKLRKLIKNEHIDVIHTHSDVVAVHAYIASRFLNVKNVLSFHGNTYANKFNLKRNWSLKYVVPRMDACVAVSTAYLDVLKDRSLFPTSNFNVVYNGVDFKKFENIAGNLKKELGLPDNTLLIGMVGNFNWVRDQYSICKALPKIFQKLPNARFVFVGSRSEEYPEVFDSCVKFCSENNISDKVYFLGRRTDVPSILRSLDLYLYASKSDSFGISLVEAMYCGVPLLINDLPVFLELTSNGKYASIFKSSDTEDLTGKLLSLVGTGSSVEKAKKAQAYVTGKFSIKEHIKNMSIIYRSL